jgi:hypothetical protein
VAESYQGEREPPLSFEDYTCTYKCTYKREDITMDL